jgi:hypothetical protein
MQARIAGEWRDSDLIAPIDGLPEGLSQTEFTTEYGGVEGSVYRRWSDLIDQRVRSSLLLQVFRD